MEKFKKYFWVINTIAFLIVFVFLFIKVSYLFRPVSVNRENVVGYYEEPENTLDVVLIGGSSTYVFWAPYEAWNAEGIASYCFSTDSMSPALLMHMIEEASKTQSPQLYVIDLRALDVAEEHKDFYTEAYLRNVTDSLKYSKTRNEMIKYAFDIEQPELKYDIAKYFDLCMYHSNWQNIDSSNYKFMENNVSNEFKGFMFVNFAYHKPFKCNNYNYVDYEIELSEKTERILIDLLKYCKANKLNVLFTLNPFYQDSEMTKARYNYVERIVSEHGYEFFDSNDYYEEMGIDFSTDFYNRDHVNLYGAEKYTRFLANCIKEKYSVPDRRNDENYAEWDIGYEMWEEKVNAHKILIDENTYFD